MDIESKNQFFAPALKGGIDFGMSQFFLPPFRVGEKKKKRLRTSPK